MTRKPSFPRVATQSGAAVLTGLALTSCAAAGAAATSLIGLDILRKTFDGAAAKNYGESYRNNADDLFKAISKPAADHAVPSQPAPETPAAPAAAEARASDPPPATAAAASPAAAPAPAEPKPLALEVGIFKESVLGGRSVPVPVQDGEILYDGFGDHGAGDQIKFMFRTNVDAYVYVISIDGTGWIQPVFPSRYSGSANPVQANQTYLFPEGSMWAPLDSYRGVEHLYFIASRSPRSDLEQSLVAFGDRARGIDPSRAAGTAAVALAQVSESAPVTRGFDAPRKSAVQDVKGPTGEAFTVDSQLFVSNAPGDILVGRWFHHQ